jgi:transposase
MLAERVDYVVGVDTHRDQHTIAVVAAATGGVVARVAVRTDARGYREALRFADRHAPGVRVWAIEGAGHYGAAFARSLSAVSETVLEASRSLRSDRRLRGKNDPLDAVRAARSALATETLTRPRAGERQEALRVLLLARRSAVDVRRLALVQLRSVVVTAPEQLRAELRQLPTGQLIRRCSRFRRSDSRSADGLAVVLVLRSLARRILAATEEANETRARDPRPRPRHRPDAARRSRGRPDRRRSADRDLVASRPCPQRGRLRPPRRRCTLTGLERPDNTPPTQPRRRSPTQPRTPHNRPAPTPARRRNPRLHRPPDRRRQNQPRSDAHAQALPRPPPLPRHAERESRNDLTVIGDSFPNTRASGLPVAGFLRVME